MFRTALVQSLLACSLLKNTIVEHTDPITHPWDYQRYGPDTWPRMFDTCQGDSQSPIDIRLSHVRYEPHLLPLLLNGYTTNSSSYMWNFTHTGHIITAYPPPLARLSLSGASLSDVFFLAHFDVHWGYNAYQGSEHTIDGVKYPLEIQFVHQARTSNAYAILSVLFDLKRDDNPRIDDLLSIFNQTTDAFTSVEHRLNISRLFASMSSPRFYLYKGSLTSPPCTEAATWIVLARPMSISAEQLEIFARNSVPSNFRHPQKLYARKISANFQPDIYAGMHDEATGNGHESSGASTQASMFCLVVIVVMNWSVLSTDPHLGDHRSQCSCP